MKTIILTGGGTAGHVMPHLALLPELRKHFTSIHYIGSQNGIEQELISAITDIVYHAVPTVKLVRSFTPKNLLIPVKLFQGIRACKKIIKELKPDVVFSKGGFVSVPAALAASGLKVPVVTHESDSTLGLGNKIILRRAKCICCSFEKTVQQCKGKGKYTGTAIRQELFRGSRETGIRECGFTKNLPVLLIMGGSLGAKAVNEVIYKALPELTKLFNVIHITGKNATPPTAPNYKTFPFVSRIEHFLSAADIVVSRAGSNAICELLALKKPMILIPLPKGNSRGDQVLNAHEFKKKKYCEVIEQEKLTCQTLLDTVNKVLVNKNNYIKNMTAVADGKNNIIAEIINVLGK